MCRLGPFFVPFADCVHTYVGTSELRVPGWPCPARALRIAVLLLLTLHESIAVLMPSPCMVLPCLCAILVQRTRIRVRVSGGEN